MRTIRIGAVQFEAADGDKDFNFGRIEALAHEAVAEGAELVSFHECSIPGYTFLENLTRDQVAELAEPVPGGPSTERLIALAGTLGATLAAGLVEIEDDKLYNTYIVVDGNGLLAKHRKIHAFVHDALTCGGSYTVFDHLDCRFGILI
ncbi:MAG: nitrilase, partial [bacterium]|nr:nitrilase [bacterium]